MWLTVLLPYRELSPSENTDQLPSHELFSALLLFNVCLFCPLKHHSSIDDTIPTVMGDILLTNIERSIACYNSNASRTARKKTTSSRSGNEELQLEMVELECKSNGNLWQLCVCVKVIEPSFRFTSLDCQSVVLWIFHWILNIFLKILIVTQKRFHKSHCEF